MRKTDIKLGMDRPITRRDFVNGVAVVGAAVSFAGPLSACDVNTVQKTDVYPPGFTGMRGNHDSSFTVAHALGREGKTDWGPVLDVDNRYDLVVVGAGISGLAAACFYRRDNPDARILILDNHDDFGGHAKRNEFEINGHTLLVEGGSQNVTSPDSYSDVVKGLLDEIGVELPRLAKAIDADFSAKNGLGGGYHFNKESWGETATVKSADISKRRNLADPSITLQETISHFPMSDKAKQELLHLFTTEMDQLPELNQKEKVAYFSKISYRDFLIQYIGITEQSVFDFLQDQTRDIGLGIDATDAYLGMTYAGLPGLAATGIENYEDFDAPDFYIFPDGNASLTRLMVRSLIPGVAPGNTMEDSVMARFDYGKLDSEDSSVRLRLNSTVINATNDADRTSVTVSYVQDGKAFRVRADKSILACNNAMIPYLCPDMAEAQKEALANQVRQPILESRVLVKNWRAWKEMGIARVLAPGGYHTSMSLQIAVNLGDYQCPQNPDEPIVICLNKYPHVNNEGLSAQDQFRMARYELLSTPYEEMERHIRTQLDELLGGHGFNAAEDIEAIIINRWAHGYAYSYGFHNMFEDDHADPDHESHLHVQGRKPLGNISIANSDSGGMAMLECAIDQAYRAVNEL